MADKKITQLPSLTADQLSAADVLLIVDSGDIPLSKNITVGDLMKGVKTTATSGTQVGLTDITPLRTVATANVPFTGTATLQGADVRVNATAGSSNTAYQYGLYARSSLIGPTANVTTEHAAIKGVLNLTDSGSPMVTNTYGLLVEVANTITRTVNAQAYIAFGDLAANSTTAQTQYLFDIGKNGTANVSARVGAGGTTNVSVCFSNVSSAVVATHKLRVRVNGQDFYLLLANTSEASV